MSKLGVLTSKFKINTEFLRDFDESILILRKEKRGIIDKDMKDALAKILRIIRPISENIESHSINTSKLSDNSIIKILNDRHENNWGQYKKLIIRLNSKLGGNNVELDENEFQLLDDIADALDSETEYIFKRFGER